MQADWDMLGAKVPVFAFTHSAEVCAAVSRAGGFGVLGATSHTPEQLEEELALISERVDGRPFGVDLLIPATGGGPAPTKDALNAAIPAEHREFLEGLLSSHDVPPLPPGQGLDPALMLTDDPSTMIDPRTIRELVDVALAHPGVALLASALGVPPADVLDDCRARGIKVAALGGAPEHAAKQVAAGVDVIVAQGTEAGGHTGEIATMVLVPQVVDAAEGRPVIAAGGIATGRQMAAAMALGASGVWTGSMWLVADEAVTSRAERDKILAARSSQTVRSRSRTGKTCRMMVSEWTQAFDDPRNPDPLPMPLQLALVSEPLQRIVLGADAGGEGSRALLSGICGQVIGSLREERPAAELLSRLLGEYDAALDALRDLPRFSATA